MNNKIKNKHIWDFLEKEYRNYLQGNIIYSIASEKFKKDIIISSTLDKRLWTGWYNITELVLFHTTDIRFSFIITDLLLFFTNNILIYKFGMFIMWIINHQFMKII